MKERQVCANGNLYNDRFCSHSVHRNFSCASHINFETEFIIVLDGELVMEVEEKTYPLRKNDTLVVLPFEAHAFQCRNGMYRVIMCSNAAVPAFSAFLHDKFPVTRRFTLPEPLRVYQDLLCQSAPENLTQIESDALLAPIVAEFVKQCEFKQGKSINSSLFTAALKFVNEHFLYDITLDEVAKAISCHPVSLSRVFRAATGCSFPDYLNLRRCYYAKTLLETTDGKINEIAVLAGFGSTRNFNRCFQKTFSITPSKHRKIFQ